VDMITRFSLLSCAPWGCIAIENHLPEIVFLKFDMHAEPTIFGDIGLPDRTVALSEKGYSDANEFSRLDHLILGKILDPAQLEPEVSQWLDTPNRAVENRQLVDGAHDCGGSLYRCQVCRAAMGFMISCCRE
jgi:hypothetical protein